LRLPLPLPLPCLALLCFTLLRPALPCSALPCPALPYLALRCVALRLPLRLPCLTFAFVLPYFALPWPAHLTLRCVVLRCVCLALFYLSSRCPGLPCPALPCIAFAFALLGLYLCSTLPRASLACPALPCVCLVLHCVCLPCLAFAFVLHYFTLPWPAAPCLACSEISGCCREEEKRAKENGMEAHVLLGSRPGSLPHLILRGSLYSSLPLFLQPLTKNVEEARDAKRCKKKGRQAWTRSFPFFFYLGFLCWFFYFILFYFLSDGWWSRGGRKSCRSRRGKMKQEGNKGPTVRNGLIVSFLREK